MHAHTRRRFLATGAAASAAVLLGGFETPARAKRRQKRVVILGAAYRGW